MKLGWQVLPEFRIVQHERDINLLWRIKNTLGCGNVTTNHGNRKELRVRGLENLNKIVKFFDLNKLQTKKQADFDLFRRVIVMMNEKKHLSSEGLIEIAEIASLMNRKVRRKCLESPETIR